MAKLAILLSVILATARLAAAGTQQNTGAQTNETALAQLSGSYAYDDPSLLHVVMTNTCATARSDADARIKTRAEAFTNPTGIVRAGDGCLQAQELREGPCSSSAARSGNLSHGLTPSLPLELSDAQPASLRASDFASALSLSTASDAGSVVDVYSTAEGTSEAVPPVIAANEIPGYVFPLLPAACTGLLTIGLAGVGLIRNKAT